MATSYYYKGETRRKYQKRRLRRGPNKRQIEVVKENILKSLKFKNCRKKFKREISVDEIHSQQQKLFQSSVIPVEEKKRYFMNVYALIYRTVVFKRDTH